MKSILAILGALVVLPLFATGTLARAADPQPDDVIARVGDQTITFSELNTAMNSSGIFGITIPLPGTRERDTARIVLLDRFVSANLLYLDARKQGVDQDPGYQKKVRRFSNGILAGLYRQRIQAGEIPVTDEEIQAYYKKNISSETELTDDVRLQIEARLRREKLHARLAAAAKTLRDDVHVVVHPENLAVDGDDTRAADTPLAQVGAETITWGQMDDRIITAGKGAKIADASASAKKARRAALETEIDVRIMVQKAKAEGLDRDPVYQRRLREYQKALLINLHRERVVKGMEPSAQELEAYYDANRRRLVVPEARKVQMVVVKTRQEAEDLKAKIEAGKMTMYQAARDYSIAAKAKEDLGQVGWIRQGEVAPALDTTIFLLAPGKIGGPVQLPAGWELVTVLDVTEAKYTDFADPATRELTRRRCLHDRLAAYTAALRQHQFTVEVYQDRLVQLAQQEADQRKAAQEKTTPPAAVTEKTLQEMKQRKEPSM